MTAELLARAGEDCHTDDETGTTTTEEGIGIAGKEELQGAADAMMETLL